MSTSDVPLSSTISASTLDEAALGFVASPKFSRQLESKRNAVLTLRARDASYRPMDKKTFRAQVNSLLDPKAAIPLLALSSTPSEPKAV